MRSGKFAAKFGSDTLKECLKDLKQIGLQSLAAFSFVGAVISAFFPSSSSECKRRFFPEVPRIPHITADGMPKFVLYRYRLIRI